MTDNTGGTHRHHSPAAATSSIRHPPVHPKPPPHSRRTSLSPVLTALQPGNYHIANLPDIDLDGSSSSSSESEALDTSRPDAVRGRGGNGRANTNSSKLGGNSKAPLSPLPPTSALPLAINTTLLHALQTSHCDTGDSTITPLSVVNVPAGALSTCSTSPSSQASRAGGYDTSRVVPFEHGEQGGIGGSPVIFDAEEYGSSSPSFVVVDADTTTSPVVFDAESLGSDHEEDDTSVLDGNAAAHHFDLVENAVPIEELTTTNAIRGKESDGVDIATAIEEAIREFEVWDAAGEIVRPGNYEVYSGGKSDEMQSGVEPPTTSTLDGNMTLGQQQQLSASTAGSSASSAFKVMGVRHVSTYSPDFDKTAASLLSSIKTDIAKRVATANSSGGGGSAAGGGGGSGEENKRRDFASAASIAAAIEHHQQKKQQQQEQQKQQTGVMEEVGEHRYLHSSRLSGFFGFGQRTQRGGGGNGGNGSGAALQPLSAPQPRGGRAPSPKAAAVAADLRVVTDLQTLRGAGRSGGSNDQITTTTTTGGGEGGAPSSSGDGQKKSSNTSPSATLMARRWRVPFIQRVVSSGDPGDIGSARRRSRGRAGTTSDIESPHAASSAGDNRPFSMVEGSSSNSNNNSGRSTPRITATGLLQQQQRFADSPAVTSASAADSPSSQSFSYATASPSSRSFVTASPGEAPPRDPSPVSRADSWTLMFFSKEFVVPQKVEMLDMAAAPVHTLGSLPSSPAATAAASAAAAAAAVVEQPGEMEVGAQEKEKLDRAREDEQNGSDAANDGDDDDYDDDDLLWGGAAPPLATEDDDDPVAAAMRADIAEQQEQQQLSDNDGDARSATSSTRTLPSTMRFTRGMRAALLERQPSRNVRERPTADVIGDQLDKYFPDHDLDRRIVQAVPVDNDGSQPLDRP
ncbi:hypothetical protein LPJ72_006049, partial [Coemansia sp. Benny D160-2]